MKRVHFIEKNMMSFLGNELSGEAQEAFERHLGSCISCTQAVEEFREVWNLLSVVEDQSVPDSLRSKIIQNAREAELADTRNLVVNLRNSLKKPLKSMTPIFMGLLTTSLFAIILSFRIDLESIPPLGLTVAGALWTGLFALVFYLFTVGSKQEEPSWKFLAQASLIAVGIFLVMTFVTPLPHSVRFCSNYQLTQPLLERLSIGGTYFLFGSLYALIPMSIAAYLSANRRGKNPLLRGTLAGGMFMLLLIPGIFLQCAPFALGVVLGWFGGALVGSVIGGVIGYWIRYRLAGRIR